MYIEYITSQRVADPYFTDYKSNGGDYRPTWLVRTSDWQKVPGHNAIKGYHTLSYVWEQSGEMFEKEDGEYRLNDNGDHQITTITFKKRKPGRSARKRKVKCSVRVTYDALVQQICKDFDIEYLWYDKICIDQNNKEEKHREIKQMHLIYSNACFTLAMVPEINIKETEEFEEIEWMQNCTKAKNTAIIQMMKSLWWQRSWTLEELMMSARILIVGKNTHFWSLADIKQREKKENELLATTMLGFKERRRKSVNQVLKEAHFRTSTKEHDKIFALANIFAGIIEIEVDYKVDVSATMNNFYRQLAEHDLSIICFGSVLNTRGAPRYATTMSSYRLPSWTGVAGLHTCSPNAEVTLDDLGNGYFVDEKMNLRLKGRSYTIQTTEYGPFDLLQDDERGAKAQDNYYEQAISLSDFDDEQEAFDYSQYSLYVATGCIPTNYWKPAAVIRAPCSPIVSLSLTETCDECVILSILFTIANEVVEVDSKQPVGFSYDYLAPVAKKNDDDCTYKIIGVMHLRHFTHTETAPSARDYMDLLFNEAGCVAREFCIV